MLIGPCKVLVHCGYWLEGEKAELKVPDPDPGFRDHVFVEELKTASPVLLQGKYPIVTGIEGGVMVENSGRVLLNFRIMTIGISKIQRPH